MSHHSIGEVLSLLKEEHPDITISKVRFLENQGLIEPERTPSGYRKFYDGDIERLRWILTQQRDNFLPLKVIKRRLEEAGFEPIARQPNDASPVPEPALFAGRHNDDPTPEASARVETARESPPKPDVQSATPTPAVAGSVSLTATELAAAANVDAHLLTDLLKLGLIEGHDTGSDTIFDDEALVVARAAASLSERGMEARHLRMFKVSAERESGVYEQLLAPLSRRGKAAAATAELNELLALADIIRRSLLRRTLGVALD